MRLRKKVWIIVGIAIIVALLAVVSNIYLRQVAEQQDLEDSLDTATDRSITLTAEKGDLEDELAQAESLLATSQAEYPQEIHSIEYGEHIFEIVERCHLTLASLTFPKPSAATVGSVAYRVVSLSLPVSGAREDIFAFIDIIRTDPRFASTRVNSVSLSGGSATISVTIYSYKR